MPASVEDTLRAEPKAPARARAIVRQLSIDEETRRNLELIVSELVTNSVVHGETATNRTLLLKLRCEPAAVSGEVCDYGGGFEWEPHEPELGEPGGLGLMVVDHLAERWGVRRNGGVCVWFECVCSEAS
jgi:two-component sensor histidine kinase